MADATPPIPSDDKPAKYVVVARRYRPQLFEELIGQEHVAQALSNAISTNRVGHAYLFTGARGVGKTSAARIFAKALNCEAGPSPTPCNQCDICEGISSGEDVDVLEIDGASNRGIDEIRQLRQNVNVRPSRTRFKIYIIDEVHMLTREAFNALLKTLEEPPEHVKFIFCTTEPTKIPITILSRCQRFDFAGILTASICKRLEQIATAEGVEADSEALEVLARRAAGSMRDSQSLLEQLLAFSPGKITLDDVHGMLGTAGDERLTDLVTHLLSRDAAAAIDDLDQAVTSGVDVAQLIEQLFGYLRDSMASAVGCDTDAFLYASPSRAEEVVQTGKQLGLHTILAAMQILDHTLSRMRYSTQGRILAELALVRICNLEDLDDLQGLIAQLQSGAAPSPPAKGGARPAPGRAPAGRTTAPLRPRERTVVAPREPVSKEPAATVQPDPAPTPSADAAPAPAEPTATAGAPTADVPAAGAPPAGPGEAPATPISAANAAEMWSNALGKIKGLVAEQAKEFDRVAFAPPNRLVVFFKARHALAKSSCERPEQLAKFKKALQQVAGQAIDIAFEVEAGRERGTTSTAAKTKAKKRSTRSSPHQRMMEVAKDPLITRASELFGAQPTRVDEPSEDEPDEVANDV